MEKSINLGENAHANTHYQSLLLSFVREKIGGLATVVHRAADWSTKGHGADQILC